MLVYLERPSRFKVDVHYLAPSAFLENYRRWNFRTHREIQEGFRIIPFLVQDKKKVTFFFRPSCPGMLLPNHTCAAWMKWHLFSPPSTNMFSQSSSINMLFTMYEIFGLISINPDEEGSWLVEDFIGSEPSGDKYQDFAEWRKTTSFLRVCSHPNFGNFSAVSLQLTMNAYQYFYSHCSKYFYYPQTDINLFAIKVKKVIIWFT